MATLMNGNAKSRMPDTLAIFENWLLGARSDRVFRLTHPCSALDDPSILWYEEGGILTINLVLTERNDRAHHKSYTDAIRVVSDEKLPQAMGEKHDQSFINSRFDKPLHFVKNQRIPTSSSAYDVVERHSGFSKIKIKWPIPLGEFLRQTKVYSTGLSRLFVKAEAVFGKYVPYSPDPQVRKYDLAITEASAEFVPISHLIFSEDKKYKQRLHFSVVGTSDDYSILPPRFSAEISSDFNQFLPIIFYVWLILGVLFIQGKIEASLFIISFPFLIFLAAVPHIYEIPATVRALKHESRRKKSESEENDHGKRLKKHSTASTPIIVPRDRLILLAGPVSAEKTTFFCFLIYELCRGKKIAVSDYWIQTVLAAFLDVEVQSYGNSILCNWEVTADKTHNCEISHDPDYNKVKKKMERKIMKKENIHFLDAAPSIFQTDGHMDKIHLLKEANSIVFFISGRKGNLTEKKDIKKYIHEIYLAVGRIAASKKVKPEEVPIFIVFDGFTREEAKKIIYYLNQKDFKPKWHTIDVNAARTQYLEGLFDVYDDFINAFWNFVEERKTG